MEFTDIYIYMAGLGLFGQKYRRPGAKGFAFIYFHPGSAAAATARSYSQNVSGWFYGVVYNATSLCENLLVKMKITKTQLPLHRQPIQEPIFSVSNRGGLGKKI
jgi:hypothetical protein